MGLGTYHASAHGSCVGYQAALEAALDFTKPKFDQAMRSGHANM